jgi:N-acetyl sugar amidotransferase
MNATPPEYSRRRDRPYQVCATCVMDTSDSAIRFNSAGICDHCVTFERHTKPNWLTGAPAQRALHALAGAIRRSGEGRDFDCIVGLSGGVDSSYLAYVAKEVMGLRPLVFHVDAGWNSELAVQNIEKIVDGLSLDLFTEVIDWPEMADLQLAFFKSGVPHIDVPQDHAFFATMYKFAEKYNVNSILTGANLATECVRNPLEWMYYQSDSIQLRDIHRRFGARPLVNYPVTSILRHKVWLPYVKGIRVERPLNLVDYNKKTAIEFLSTRFGWRPYPQKHFESRFTRFYEGYWLPRRFGYDVRRVQFSSLILTGQMTRTEALRLLESPALDEAAVRREFDFVAEKLEISRDELQAYLDSPRKTYRHYRSQDLLYGLGSRVLKLFGLEIGGKR